MKRQISTPKNKFPNLASLGPITTPFGGSTAYEKIHPGIDLAFQKNTPIPSPTQGTVLSTVTGKKNGDAGFGNIVVIQAPNGDKLQFGHLENVYVRPGQQIQSGQQIATGGNSGSAYSQSGQGDGSHLDIRVVNAFRRFKNPANYIKKRF